MISLLRTTFLIGLLILVGATVWLAHLRADDAFMITFTSTRTGYPEIYMTGIGGSITKRLSKFAEPHQSVAMPFRYSHWNRNSNCLIFLYGKRSYCVDAPGVRAPDFDNEPPPPKYYGSLRRYNDRFVYTGRPYGDWVLFTVENLGLFRAHPDGSGLLQLSEHYATSIEYLAQQQQIVFFNNGWFIVSIDGNGEHFIESRMTSPHHLTISPDQEWILARISHQGMINNRHHYIYKVINRKTSRFRYITVFSHEHPIWSPDSRYLLYEGEDGFYSLDTRSLTEHLAFSIRMPVYQEIIEDSFYRHFEYEWSADNRFLLIEVHTELYVLKSDGTDANYLTDGIHENYLRISLHRQFADYFKDMHWSPDGKWIVFQAEIPYTTSDIFRVRPDGSGLKNITNNPNWDVTPYWVPFEGRSWTPHYLLTAELNSIMGIVVMLFSSAVRRRLRA